MAEKPLEADYEFEGGQYDNGLGDYVLKNIFTGRQRFFKNGVQLGDALNSGTLDENKQIGDIENGNYIELQANGEAPKIFEDYVEIGKLAIEKKEVDVIIAIGQSNIAGSVGYDVANYETIESGNAFEFRAITDPTKLYHPTEPLGVNENLFGGIDDVNDPSGSRTSKKSGGPMVSFLKYYNITSGKIPVFVSATQGATSSSQWLPGQGKVEDALNRLNSCKNWLISNGYAIGETILVWAQGEFDGGTPINQYLSNVRDTFGYLANDVDKIIIQRVGRENSEVSYKGFDKIAEAQTLLAKESEKYMMGTCLATSFFERGLMIDQYHYSQIGYNELGKENGISSGLWRTNRVEPTLRDTLRNFEYVPFYRQEAKLLFDFYNSNENFNYDIYGNSVASGGVITTTGNTGYKRFDAVDMYAGSPFTIEFSISPDGTRTGFQIILGGEDRKNFVSYNSSTSNLRIRSINDRTIDFTIDPVEVLNAHSWTITFDGIDEFNCYMDAVLVDTVTSNNWDKIEPTTILGGYWSITGDSGSYTSSYDFSGECKRISIIDRIKPIREMLQSY